MRDANGTGSVYFEDLFANGIPISSLIFWILNGAIGYINTILTPIFFYNLCLKRSYHRNFRLITSNLYLIFFVTSFGNFIYTILILTHTSDRQYGSIFLFCDFVLITGPGVWKTTFLAIILERAAATIFYKVYETNAPLALGIILQLFGLTGCLLPFFYIFFQLDMIAGVVISLSISFICWMSIYLLYWVNKKLRMLNSEDKIRLSHRYQVTENLRFLQIMIPIIIFGCIIDPTATIIASVSTIIDYKNSLYYPIYTVLTNLYVPLFYFIYFKKDKHTRMMILKFINFKSSKVEPTPNQLKNIVGDLLVINNSSDTHFKALNKVWS